MAISVDPASVDIDIHNPKDVYSDVDPGRGTLPRVVTAYITDSSVKSRGIWMKGDVKFLLGPGDTLAGWKVGFFQVVRMATYSVRYSGRIGSEGSIVIDPLAPLVGVSTKTLLDCLNTSHIPWALKIPDGTEFTGPKAHVMTQDNPRQPLPATLQNPQKSNIDNFLYDFRQDCEFWTILTAMDPAKSRQYLAYIHWQFVHKVDFFWRTGDVLPSEWGAFQVLDKGVSGPPSDPAVQAILKNQVGPIANAVFGSAIKTAFTAPSTPYRTDSDKGLSPMRMDFWRANELPANVA